MNEKITKCYFYFFPYPFLIFFFLICEHRWRILSFLFYRVFIVVIFFFGHKGLECTSTQCSKWDMKGCAFMFSQIKNE